MANKLEWQFGEAMELLDKEVDKIVSGKTVTQLLTELPDRIPYDEIQDARLQFKKLGDLVWQVSYVIYRNPKARNFEEISIKFTTEPSLRLAMFEMLQEINKKK